MPSVSTPRYVGDTHQPLRITGTGENCHAYWPLTAPLVPDLLEDANRRIATALGADLASVDAARVLRPPGSLNFKSHPPGLVRLEAFTGERFETTALLAALPDEPVNHERATRPPQRPAPRRVEDPLRSLDPEVYVAALTGQQLGRDRKVSCPFHRPDPVAARLRDPRGRLVLLWVSP